MFNQEKSVSDLQQMLLVSKLSICAEEAEANYRPSDFPYIRTCIKEFVCALSDYEHGYVSSLSKRELEELVALIQEPKVLALLTHHQLDLHWIFGFNHVFKGEQREISARIKRYNMPWGKDTTLSLVERLSTPFFARLMTQDVFSLYDVRQWDKGSELGMEFVHSALTYLARQAVEIQAQLDNQTFNKTALHLYLLEQGKEGLDRAVNV